jgi:hypothetical protein
MDSNALGVRAGAAQQEMKHRGAGIDGVDVNRGIFAEQAGGEPAVAVTEDQGAT